MIKTSSIFSSNEIPNLYDYMKYKGIANSSVYMSHRYLDFPYLYNNIKLASEVISEAIKNNISFYLLLDEDCDGIFSTCIQYMYLKKCNPNLDITVLFHNKNRKSHGLDDQEILSILKNTDKTQRKILWIADASCNDTEEYKMLQEYGYVGINTDHHDFIQENPYAIIVNNQYSKNVTNKSLSGAGVTFKLCQAIDMLNNTKYANEFISYVHLSNISDSCEFIHPEQNTFRYWGLKNIHPYIQPFIDKFNYNGGLKNMDFSFGLVSRFNAVIRVGSLEEKKTLFMSLTNGKNIDEAINICKKCKTEQDEIRDGLLENNINLCYNSNVVIFKIDTKTSLTGLIAGRLMSKYNKPIFLLHERTNGEIAGSCRSTVDLRSLCEQSGLFNYASGHEKSYGLSYQKENEDKIFEWIDNLELKEPTIEVLQSYSAKSIPANIFSSFSDAEYIYGQGIPKPLVHIKNIIYKPKDIKLLGAKKRTMKLNYGGVDYLIFMLSNEDKELLNMKNPNQEMKMELVGTLGVNEWRGKKTNQIIIEKFETKKYDFGIDSLF